MTPETYTAPAKRPDLTERDCILQALSAWVRQRPGLDFRDYGDVPAFRAERKRIVRQLRDAEDLLRAVRKRGISAGDLKGAFERAFSGRLTWTPATRKLDYCTGQYWPTEFRAAACAVLAAALWNYFRACVPEHVENKGNAIREMARAQLGGPIAKRWFDWRRE